MKKKFNIGKLFMVLSVVLFLGAVVRITVEGIDYVLHPGLWTSAWGGFWIPFLFDRELYICWLIAVIVLLVAGIVINVMIKKRQK